MVILVDTNKGGRDGLVDQWFTLESAASLAPLSEHLTAAQLVHTSGYLRVTSPADRVVYDFVVAGHDRGLDIPAGFTAVRNEGFGLAHNIAPTNVRIPEIRRDGVTAFNCEGCDVVYPCDGCDTGGSATNCSSGGTGSTSCSSTSGTQSCSVSCGQGYYACCNSNSYIATCKCIKS